MKNLKKVLSLVLALSMALSLMTVAFAADAGDFADYDKVEYNEAVDVMVAAGVFNGKEGNNFAPNDTLTREEAAKIVTYMLVGQEKADKLTATVAPYADVAAGRWSAGAIAYCTNEGILTGSNGKFYPTDKLTGVAFAKMLLVALGYDPKIESLEGSAWAINTAKLALGDADLDNGMEEISLSSNLTREQAAQMAFNAMKANVVDYENRGNSIVINGVEISQGASKAEPVKDNGNKKGTIAKDEILQFAEKYCEKLSVSTKSSDKADDFGRPAATWVYDKETVGSYADSADHIYVVDAGDKDLATIVTDSDYMDLDAADILSNAKVYRNGTAANYSADKTNKVGKGDILEVYQNDDGDVTTIVVRSYTYAQIDKVEDDLGSALTKKGASYSVTLKDIDGSFIGGTYYDEYENNSAVVLQGFNANTYTEDAVLAVALNGTKVLDSYVAEAVTGTPSSAKAVVAKSSLVTDGNVTINGEKYEYAGTMTGLANGNNVAFDKEYTIYLSKDGYVIGVDGSAAVSLDDVYYVTGVYSETNKGEKTYFAQAVSLKDGKTSEIMLEGKDNNAILGSENPTLTEFTDTTKGLYTFTDDKESNSKADDGKFNATAYTGASNNYAVVKDTLKEDVSKSSVSIQFATGSSNTTGQTGDDTSKLYITKNTQFLGIESKGSSLKVSSAIGMMQQAKNTSVIAIAQDGKTEAVYVLYVGDELNSTVSTADVVYLTDKTSTENSKGYEGTLYFMDSKDSVNVTVKDKKDAAGFFTYKVDKDDVYDLEGDGNAISGSNVTIDKSKTGSVMNLPIKNSYNQNLTGKVNNITFNDVDYSGATVIDTRSESDRNKDVYTSEITSPSALEAAVKKGTDVVTKANVYVEDGKVTFIAVTEVKNDTAASGGETGDVKYTASVKLTAGTAKINLTPTLSATTPTTADKLDGTLTYKVEVMNPVNGNWMDAGFNGSLKITDGNCANGDIAVSAAGNYRVHWTLSIEGAAEQTGTTPFVTVTAMN